MSEMSRRNWLKTASVMAGGALVAGCGAPAGAVEEAPAAKATPRFRFSLNTSTIRGQKLTIEQEVDLAAKAGYDGIEPWIGELEKHVGSGGTLKDLKKRMDDGGLKMVSAIGFAPWIVDDDQRRAKGLEQAKREMDMVAQLGGANIAAPPAGATDKAGLDLLAAAERYRALLEVGLSIGVVPMVEVWGFSKVLSRVGESYLVAIEADHPKAALLPDVYHIYKGGSGFHTLGMLNGTHIPVFHMNDYPAQPDRTKINDAHRVFPGDGTAPMAMIMKTLKSIGMNGFLSLELFNPEYYKRDALQVAQEGLAKMKKAAMG